MGQELEEGATRDTRDVKVVGHQVTDSGWLGQRSRESRAWNAGVQEINSTVVAERLLD